MVQRVDQLVAAGHAGRASLGEEDSNGWAVGGVTSTQVHGRTLPPLS